MTWSYIVYVPNIDCGWYGIRMAFRLPNIIWPAKRGVGGSSWIKLCGGFLSGNLAFDPPNQRFSCGTWWFHNDVTIKLGGPMGRWDSKPRDLLTFPHMACSIYLSTPWRHDCWRNFMVADHWPPKNPHVFCLIQWWIEFPTLMGPSPLSLTHSPLLVCNAGFLSDQITFRSLWKISSQLCQITWNSHVWSDHPCFLLVNKIT